MCSSTITKSHVLYFLIIDMTKWWCTIENSLLSYYEDENNTVPEGCIDLSEVVCMIVYPTDFILDSG